MLGAKRTIWFFFGILVLLNVFGPLAIDSTLCNSGQNRLRNHCFKRGWPEHLIRSLERLTSTELKSIAVVGNSQAYGLEVADSKSYTGILQKKNSNWRWANLSLYGGRAPEFIALLSTIKTNSSKPGTLLFIVGRENFDSRYYENKNGTTVNLNSFQSDVKYLLNVNVLANLPNGFEERYITTVDRMEIEIGGRTLWRYRDLPIDLIMTGLKKAGFENTYLRSFGKDFRGYRWIQSVNTYWERFKKRQQSLQKGVTITGKSKNKATPKLQVPVLKRRGFKLSRELLQMTIESLAKTAKRVIWVTMPVHSALHKDQASFHQLILDHYNNKSIEFIDKSKSIDDDNFIGRSHFKPKGHQVMAEVITNILAETTPIELEANE